MRKCSYCGSQMADNDPFCTHCGAMADKMKEPAQPGTAQYQQSSSQRYTYSSGRRSNRSGMITMLVITIFVLIAAFAGVSIISDLLNSGNTSSTEMTVEYSWDYYTDDTNCIHYTYTLTVPNSYYNKISGTTIDRTGSSSDVHLSTSEGTIYAVSEYIVVDDYIKKVSTDLRALYDADKTSSKIPATADFASFISAFVQGSITYQTDSDYTGGKYTEYWKYPLETLCDKKGDCEDTSILIAALLDASATSKNADAKYTGGIFLLPGHAMGAVKADEVSESRVGSNIRYDYYPIESTADNNQKYKLGTVSGDNPLEDKNNYTGDYFHLYTGYSTSYYGVTFS